MMFDTCTKRKQPYPPFNDLTAPLEDTHMKDAKGKKIKTKEGKFKVKEGYAGKAKGVAQVLWERGLWVEGMKMKLDVDDPDYPELSASTVLANCEDFREEVGAMEKLVASEGHICLFSSKGHPEIAGAGIEYDWGVSKKSSEKKIITTQKPVQKMLKLH